MKESDQLTIASKALIMCADETYTGKHIIARRALNEMGYEAVHGVWRKVKPFTQSDFEKGLMLAGKLEPVNDQEREEKKMLEEFELRRKEVDNDN